MNVDSSTLAQIERHGQQHVLKFWNELSTSQQSDFAQQLQEVDWDVVGSLLVTHAVGPESQSRDARKIAPPRFVVRTPRSLEELQRHERARGVGEEQLRAGKVAAVLLAGGQGTRLGFSQPKGMFPIGPASGNSLFQILAEQIVATSRRYECRIPYLVMTSDGTHVETIEFFHRHNSFGLNPDDVFFFQQGFVPSFDMLTGKLLLADKGQLVMSPDGHGGLLAALWKADLFDTLRERGIEYLFTHQVDNPLVHACDPTFIGLHLHYGAQVSTKVVAKLGPDEKVGVAVDQDGHTAIVEYSDLAVEQAQARDAQGGLQFWAGSTAIHLFDRAFIEDIARSSQSLPWHRAIKRISCVNEAGHCVQPEIENGVKFERFLFDTLPLASTALIVETVRDDEFAPLKNQSGEFSADYVRCRMSRVATNWLRSSRISVPDQCTVEISPLVAMSADELAAHQTALTKLNFDAPVFLSPERFRGCEGNTGNCDTTGGANATALGEPLVFESYCRPQVWGGRGLETLLGHALPANGPFGESWDLSSQKLHVSRVSEGPFRGRDLQDLWAHHRGELAGAAAHDSFPLLIKWLECRELLSVQVHPDDQMAQRLLGEPYGKSEAWVVIAAEPTARIYAGLKPGVTRTEFEAGLKNNTVESCLHSFTPRVGDCINIPAGTIHAAGGGLMVAEVQQSSDATFRLYDWNRLGLDGKPRALQIERGLEAVNWSQGAIAPLQPFAFAITTPGSRGESLVNSPALRLERYTIEQSFCPPDRGDLTVWMVLDGSAELQIPSTGYRRVFRRGTTTMVPALVKNLVWKSTDNSRPLKLLCTRYPGHTA